MIQDPILSIHMINKIKIDIGNQPYLKIPLIVETIIFEFFFLHAYKEYVKTHTHTEQQVALPLPRDAKKLKELISLIHSHRDNI
jgi:hypothetical protein